MEPLNSAGMPVLILGANAMAAFMDLGVGILVVALIAAFLGTTIPPYYLFIGGLLALLPDLDLIPSVLSGHSANFDHHQTLFHRPLLILPLVTLMGMLFGGLFWALACFLCVFWHYLHDTKWSGGPGGIAWFWPFSKNYWNLHGALPPKGGEKHHMWLQHYWLKPTGTSIKEISTGSFALLLASWLGGVPAVVTFTFVAGVLLGVSSIWFVYRLQARVVTDQN